jgi:hypothetical protein
MINGLIIRFSKRIKLFQSGKLLNQGGGRLIAEYTQM